MPEQSGFCSSPALGEPPSPWQWVLQAATWASASMEVEPDGISAHSQGAALDSSPSFGARISGAGWAQPPPPKAQPYPPVNCVLSTCGLWMMSFQSCSNSGILATFCRSRTRSRPIMKQSMNWRRGGEERRGKTIILSAHLM